jgi:hypothetical protein
MERRRKKRHASTRAAVRRVNKRVAPLLTLLLVQPQEFAGRIRRSIRAGHNPRRLLKCINDVDEALSARGIHMRPYFAALRSELHRFTAAKA